MLRVEISLLLGHASSMLCSEPWLPMRLPRGTRIISFVGICYVGDGFAMERFDRKGGKWMYVAEDRWCFNQSSLMHRDVECFERHLRRPVNPTSCGKGESTRSTD